MIILGCVGGLIPDVIRFIAWGNTAKSSDLKELQARIVVLRLISFVMQSAIGGFAVYLAGTITDVRQAVGIGFAGPEFLTRLLAAFGGKRPDPSEQNSGRTPSPTGENEPKEKPPQVSEDASRAAENHPGLESTNAPVFETDLNPPVQKKQSDKMVPDGRPTFTMIDWWKV